MESYGEMTISTLQDYIQGMKYLNRSPRATEDFDEPERHAPHKQRGRFRWNPLLHQHSFQRTF